jgi:hypothetical protein
MFHRNPSDIDAQEDWQDFSVFHDRPQSEKLARKRRNLSEPRRMSSSETCRLQILAKPSGQDEDRSDREIPLLPQ